MKTELSPDGYEKIDCLISKIENLAYIGGKTQWQEQEVTS